MRKYSNYLLTLQFICCARFIAIASFIVERNLIVIETTVETTVPICTQRESILRAELFMCGFILSTKTLNTLQKRTGNAE